MHLLPPPPPPFLDGSDSSDSSSTGFQSALIWIVIICIVLALVLVCCAICGVFRVCSPLLCTGGRSGGGFLFDACCSCTRSCSGTFRGFFSECGSCFGLFAVCCPTQGGRREGERAGGARVGSDFAPLLPGQRAAKELKREEQEEPDGREDGPLRPFRLYPAASARSSPDPRGV